MPSVRLVVPGCLQAVVAVALSAGASASAQPPAPPPGGVTALGPGPRLPEPPRRGPGYRSPERARQLNLLVPGLGNAYAGEPLTGAAVLVGSMATFGGAGYSAIMAGLNCPGQRSACPTTAYWAGAAALGAGWVYLTLWSADEAARAAERHNRRLGYAVGVAPAPDGRRVAPAVGIAVRFR